MTKGYGESLEPGCLGEQSVPTAEIGSYFVRKLKRVRVMAGWPAELLIKVFD